MADESLQTYARNLRETQLGVDFGRRLYTDPGSLSTQQITATMNTLGMELPPNVQATAETAQLISSGMTAANQISTAASVGAAVAPSAAAMQLMTGVAQQNGLIDRNQASFLTVVADICLIYASGGTNIAAWLSLAQEVGFAAENNSMVAKMFATKSAIKKYEGILNFQMENAVRAGVSLSNGEMGIFGYLVEMAATAPALFEACVVKNPALAQVAEVFPGLKFIPIQTAYIEGSGHSSDWMGNQSERKTQIPYRTLNDGRFTTVEQIFTFMFNQLIYPSVRSYVEMEKDLSARGKSGITPHALIACADLGNNFQISGSRDILRRLVRTGLTPYDLGNEDIFQKISVTKSNYAVSGATIQKKSTELDREIVLYADKVGRPDAIMQNSQARKLIEEYYDLSRENLVYDWVVPEWNGQLQRVDMRSLANFVATLDMLDLVFNDPFYQRYHNSIPYMFQLEKLLPHAETFKNEAQRIYALSQARKVNYLARANIAYFLGAKDVSQIKQTNQLAVGMPATFALKGT